MSRRFCQVDVFSVRPGSGNPLAVVLDADGLDSVQMQAIARWCNLAETTFVLPPTIAEASYRVRIFTTGQEIAFAGHPSIGTANAVVAAGLVPADTGVLMQECRAGLLPVRVHLDDKLVDGKLATASVRVPHSRIVRFAESSDALLHAALSGCAQGTLVPALVEGGRRWWLAELADEQAVRQMKPGHAAIRALTEDTASLGLCVFARCTDQDFGLVVRAFPLGVGINEDPASGAANAAIAAFLDETGTLGALGESFFVSQGREMGRDSRLHLQLDAERQVWVGGGCRTLVRGQLRW